MEVNIVDDKLTVGETSPVTFTFSEQVTGFELDDLTVVGGDHDLHPDPGFEGPA
ncbi:Ig-like domain-containing protein [Aeromonas caviae]|uniref:Ig-like domain-containing protein n=1 Tax=Aeromonas caviae TaxID=648 RepID=UPI00388D3E60